MSDGDEHDLHARLVRVEEKVDHIEGRVDKHYESAKEREAKLDTIGAQQNEMLRELSRYRGFVGGILLVLTAISTFVKLFWEDFKARVFG